MATTHFNGPVASANGFEGTVTGNIVGNVTGNLTGNVSGTTLVASGAATVGSLILGAETWAVVNKTITSAELLALNAVPISVLAAPGAGLAIIPMDIVLTKAAGTAYAGVHADENLVLKYTDASGAEISPQIETTGFLDSASATVQYVGPSAVSATTNIVPVANAAVVIHLLVGEVTTGTSDIKLRMTYKIIPTVL